MHSADLAGYVLEVLMLPGQIVSGDWNRRNFCIKRRTTVSRHILSIAMPIENRRRLPSYKLLSLTV